MDDGWDDGGPLAFGVVVDEGRGSLPYALVHGEALVTAAAWALGEAGVTSVDVGVGWSTVRDAVVEEDVPFVVHDSLCPMTPPAFLRACVALAVERDAVVVGVRAVTDTVKLLVPGPGGAGADGEAVGATLDRETLVSVCSPLVLPPRVVAALDALPPLDLAVAVSVLRERFDVVQVPAPSSARRVGSPDDVAVLEALTGPED